MLVRVGSVPLISLTKRLARTTSKVVTPKSLSFRESTIYAQWPLPLGVVSAKLLEHFRNDRHRRIDRVGNDEGMRIWRDSVVRREWGEGGGERQRERENEYRTSAGSVGSE